MSKSDALLNRFGANIAQTVAPRPETATAPTAPPPDKYEGAVKARTFAEMPVDAIACGPQPRTEFDEAELQRLADSIKRFGQLAPIRVRHDAEQGAWIVLVGERRLRACRLAGLERVRVEFVERAMTEADMLAEQVVENAVRADLKPVEQARAYERLMALNGWTAQQVAETLGIEPSGVYRSLGLLRLPEDIAARVDTGEIKATAAYEISKLQIADDQRELAGRVVAEGLDHKATATEVTRRRKARSPARAKGKLRLPAEQQFRGTRGVRVTVRTTGKHSLADIAADLREIATRLDAQAADVA
jgi:ParB family transcriptional regulator, chromosome partitioning protein